MHPQLLHFPQQKLNKNDFLESLKSDQGASTIWSNSAQNEQI